MGVYCENDGQKELFEAKTMIPMTWHFKSTDQFGFSELKLSYKNTVSHVSHFNFSSSHIKKRIKPFNSAFYRANISKILFNHVTILKYSWCIYTFLLYKVFEINLLFHIQFSVTTF